MQHKWNLPPDQEANGLLYSYAFVCHGRIRLKITGSGRISGKAETQPWLWCRDRISELWIGEGVTEIGAGAFYGYDWLERLWLPGSIRRMGYMAFGNCPRLEQIVFSGTEAEMQRVIIPRAALPEHFYEKEEEI